MCSRIIAGIKIKIGILWHYGISVLHMGMFSETKHYFLISCHTFLPSDRDFVKIEKKQKLYPLIYDPSGWKEILQDSGKENKIRVNDMAQNYFYSFTQLKTRLLNISRKTVTSRADLQIPLAAYFRFQEHNSCVMKLEYCIKTEFEEYRTRKKGNASVFKLQQKYIAPNKIKNKTKLQIFKTH